ncbi:Hsp33 family molecular chaperone HslO [Halomonas koreensis]|uniref:33 kDa chaperonin n=1 Tax=Halomonas koreensis TaxID=245385 RepID=A0ABU1G7M6_9GAMM|nr:Hsp33 family molecular chaperone HslO [Halomonas koreensis]MDR5868512.1 Hsp33 family molecular chaperone HslO [Halomonas koreensis]
MTDQIQRFLFEDTNVRGEIVTLEQSHAEVMDRHDYPPAVTRQLGELLAAVALLTETIKLDGTMSLEVRGQGPLSLLMAESNPGGDLRAIARLDEEAALPAEDAGFAELVGAGQITITLDPREGHRYQGIVALNRDSLAGCLEDYFAQSEQLPTRMWLADDGQRAGGLLLQRLPDEAANRDDDAWDRTVHLAATLTEGELLGVAPQELLHRLFHEETVRIFEPKALRFACTCSRERIAGALLSLGAEELRDILAEQGGIATQCHFCHTRYEFTIAEVEAMLADPEGTSPTLH